MNTTRLLMCPPDYYGVFYEINPWMKLDHKADSKKSMAQWTAYHDLLTKELGIHVDLVEPVKGLPDMVFTANAGIVKNRTFVRSTFRYKERRGEEPYFEKWFQQHKYILKKIDRPLFFEGEGDALRMNEDIYMGHSFRSSIEAHELVAGHLKLGYYSIQLCDSRFYHLDTCFAPLNETTAVAFMPAFEKYSQLLLRENIPDIIEVPEKEAVHFGCNMLVSENQIVMPEGCPETKKELEKRGFKVYALDLSEFIKAGGAAKCLVLTL